MARGVEELQECENSNMPQTQVGLTWHLEYKSQITGVLSLKVFLRVFHMLDMQCQQNTQIFMTQV